MKSNTTTKLILWLSANMFLALTASSQAQDQRLPVAVQTVSSVATLPRALPPTIVANAPTAQSLLVKMSQVADHLNYRGAFTYQNQMIATQQSFRIDHWIENGEQHDRLMFMNGPEREILREGQSVACKSMGDKLLRGDFAQIGKALTNLHDLYRFEVHRQERVAGRLARMLLVIPRDLYRYSYFLSIDEETGLVLKFWLIDENVRPLERYEFVSIDVKVPLSEFEHIKSSPHQHKAPADITPCNPTEFGKPTTWQVGWVPPGFVFASQRMLPNGQHMLMYTDGLATFSIFLEPTTGAIPEGVGQRGATLAYLSRLSLKNSTYRVSVVGEIPIAAAAKIAQNITRP